MQKISYIRKGEGKDLVFFHGYGADKEIFTNQINYFSSRYRVTAFDFAGFGRSGKIERAYSVGDYAEETKEFLAGLGVKKPHVVAHSFGARVAVKMASREDCFDKMVLTGGAGIVNNRNAAYRIKIFRYRLVKRFASGYAEAHFGSEEYRSLSPLMKESYKKIVNEDLRHASALIKSPVLLLYGRKDKETPLSQAEIYRSFIPNAKLVVLENCGHFAFLDDAIGFNLITEEFLN